MSSLSQGLQYRTTGGLVVDRTSESVDLFKPIESLIDELDSHRGVLLTSNFEFPGRYTRWDIGFVDPAVEVRATGRNIDITAHNSRGLVLLSAINAALPPLLDSGVLHGLDIGRQTTRLMANHPTQRFTEEERSRQPSVFSVLRALVDVFRSDDDEVLGLYGAFGYDLAFQFDPVAEHHPRDGSQRDLVLYIPDQLIVVDHKREIAFQHQYDFTYDDRCTIGEPFTPAQPSAFVGNPNIERHSDHTADEYAAVVETAKEYFARGDLFEVVPGRIFSEGVQTPPFGDLSSFAKTQPGSLWRVMNLGEEEYLVSASPEMYVRVEGSRVETCPIAGTIARGTDTLSDADQIRRLLTSTKDESELTMCTDVDRNDKSRICEPASIRVIGRRQIEMYSRLFHTVDHVEGMLLPQFDGIDAFLAHTWAVTVTGAPKLWAMRFIEQHEKSPRAWYGGAIGAFLFNGNINTGITLRTIQVKQGVAKVRVGATLLVDSVPAEEEAETVLKALATLDAVRNSDDTKTVSAPSRQYATGAGKHVVLVDHEDSFVHTLAGYLRRSHATVTTLRVKVGEKIDAADITAAAPDLLVLSPGPGKPSDFSIAHTLQIAADQNIPVFGVCLGLQGMVEFYGGELGQLDYPMHGKASQIDVSRPSKLFESLPDQLVVGRYHSLYGKNTSIPEVLRVTAMSEDGVVMAVEHATAPMWGVQFHPESIMTMREDHGMQIIDNVLRQL